MQEKEIEQKIEDFDKQINELKYQRRRLEAERRKIIEERLKKLVGLCFIGIDGNYYMITGLPQAPITHFSQSPNYYQLPVYCFKVDNGEMGFKTYFSNACRYDNTVEEFFKEGNKKIAYTDFKVMAARTIQKVRDRIKGGE